jgi:tetratricopeptide (TPR) repeat protein
MATVEKASYVVVGLDDIDSGAALDGTDERVRLDVRRAVGLTSFGINAFRAKAGAQLIREHDETGVGASEQEELYLVLNGDATFNVDGERVDAPAGSLVFVGNPAAKRSAVANEEKTTVLVIGGTPGKAYDPMPVENGEAFGAYNAGDYETAYAKQQIVLEKRPDDVLAQFNAGCYAARLGRADDALEHLSRALELDGRIREYIDKDEDLDSLRADSRFAELTK